MRTLLLASLLLASLAFAQASATAQTPPILTPTGAKDTAIWVHPTDRSRSLVFGTDQLGGSGLFSYGLDGTPRQQVVTIGNTVAVDVRYGIPVGSGSTDVVLAVSPDGTFHLFSPDRDGGVLSRIDAQPTPTGSAANAGALYKSPSGGLEVFIADTGSRLRHYRATSNAAGRLTSTLLRTIPFDVPVQGLAVDDRAGRFFLTLGNRGLFVLPTEETGTPIPTLIESLDAGRLAGSEGVALYFAADGGGYLIASASQTNRFPVYSLASGFPFVTSFNLVTAGAIKGPLGTKGIEVVSSSLGAPFDQGLFVAHDNAETNYKLVGWDALAQVTTPALAVDPRLDPRTGTVPGQSDAGQCPSSDGGDAGCPSGAGGGAGGGSGSGNAGVGGILPPVGGGGGVEEPRSCGCGQAGLLFPFAALGWLLARRRTRSQG